MSKTKEWYHRNKDKAKGYLRKRRKDRREWFNEVVSGTSCKGCGESHPACIDFHHRDPSTKIDTVGNMLASLRSKDSILEEIAKCDPLCANCHRKLHWEEDEVTRGTESER